METTILHQLTKKEIRILQLIADGYSTGELAEKLFLSAHTIYTHRRNILRKTGKKDITAVIMLGVREKVLTHA